MQHTSRHFGDSIVALAEEHPPVDIDRIWTDGCAHPAEAAVDAPFLRRMRALLAAIDTDGPVALAAARRRADGPPAARSGRAVRGRHAVRRASP